MVFELPGGYWDDEGNLHREVEIKPLSGREEELLSKGGKTSPAALVSSVISQCVLHIGRITPVTEEVARRLLVADRQFILLKLRALSYGDHVRGTIRCPWADCGSKVDIDFHISSIPVSQKAHFKRTYQVVLPTEFEACSEMINTARSFTFRLPDGSDQEALSHLLNEHPANTLTKLYERCLVLDQAEKQQAAEVVNALSVKDRWILEKAFQEFAPDLNLDMEAACPECGRGFSTPFDVQDFFFGELRSGLDLLYRQVHYLAYHYHWSEREILSMTREKRMTYIDILADEMEDLNYAE